MVQYIKKSTIYLPSGNFILDYWLSVQTIISSTDFKHLEKMNHQLHLQAKRGCYIGQFKCHRMPFTSLKDGVKIQNNS